MHSTILSLVFGLLAMTLAAPSPHHSSHHHGHASGHVSISGGPYLLGNATRITTLSGSSLRTIHRTSTIIVTAPSPKSENAAPTTKADDKVANAETSQGTTGVEAMEAASAARDACNVVTVTYNPTTTVTISAASSNVAVESGTLSETSGNPAPAQPRPSSTAAAEAAASSATSSSKNRAPSVVEQPPTPPSSSVAAPSSMTAPSAVAAPTPSAKAETQSPTSESIAGSASASSSAHSTSSSTSAPAKGAGFRTKRGIIASGSGQSALVSGLTPYSKISWLGDWYSGPPNNLPTSMQFVPQNYGKQSDTNGEWTSNAKKAVAAGDKYFMSFGEPGTPNAQLHMEPQDAVTLFMQKMQPYAEQGVIIGAPGTLQNDQDFAWLSSFLDGCDKAGCSIGFLAFHWFWQATEAANFKDRFTKFTALAKGKPIWVDNFQASGTAAAQKDFLKEIVPFLESQASVQQYAYVPVDPGNGEGFLNDDGKTLSDLGAYYANL